MFLNNSAYYRGINPLPLSSMNIIQVYKKYPTQDDCIKHLEQVRWHGTPVCPYCKVTKTTPLPKENRYHCNNCNTSYSVTVGTIFHKTKIDLQKWFLAVSLVLNAKKGISARQLSRDIEVNKNTAWFMLMRIRRAMIQQGDILEGIVEADETYIGGKNKNKHNNDKKGGGQGRSTDTKVPVFGVLERGGKVRAKKVKDVTSKTLQTIINGLVRGGSKIMTDEWRSYNGLSTKFSHEKVSHNSGEYVRGEVHTNSIEGFWSLLKRGIVGQYHKVSARYLNRYIDEFCFRYNNRDIELAFNLALQRAVNI